MHNTMKMVDSLKAARVALCLSVLVMVLTTSLHVVEGRVARDTRTADETQQQEPVENRRTGSRGARQQQQRRTRHGHGDTTTRHGGDADAMDDAARFAAPGTARDEYEAPATTRVVARIEGLTATTPRQEDPTEAEEESTETRREDADEPTVQSGSGGGAAAPFNMSLMNATYANCSECALYGYERWLRIEMLKRNILKKLRMDKPPNITGPTPTGPLVQTLIERYEMQKDMPADQRKDLLGDEVKDNDNDGDDFFHSKALKVMIFGTPQYRNGSSSRTTNRIKFNFKSDMSESSVKHADLYVYVRSVLPRSPLAPPSRRLILVYQLLPENKRGRPRKPRLIETCKGKVTVGNGDWYHCNITRATKHWIQKPKKNVGIKVEVTDIEGNPLAVIAPADENEARVRPYVQVDIEEKNVGRKKRDMNGLTCKENDIEKNCCRYPLIVDFEEFKWDWIIAPKNYPANFCSGECPFVFLQRNPHTHLVQQSNPLGSTGPCCTATKLSAISMLYFDNSQNIILGKLPGMTVERCGCS